ncbi:MAG: hypothetical protein HY561_01290 [Gemmatimonadetes bacterium]|nr:hypothetical protein [Gemmatimonadota bacterium]
MPTSSLIPFHRVLIGTGIVFCAGFAGWELWRYREGAGAGALVLAVIFGLIAVGLAIYLWNLRKILKLRD